MTIYLHLDQSARSNLTNHLIPLATRAEWLASRGTSESFKQPFELHPFALLPKRAHPINPPNQRGIHRGAGLQP
jgi:hypothetical protein